LAASVGGLWRVVSGAFEQLFGREYQAGTKAVNMSRALRWIEWIEAV
jgi:hypothetical protein